VLLQAETSAVDEMQMELGSKLLLKNNKWIDSLVGRCWNNPAKSEQPINEKHKAIKYHKNSKPQQFKWKLTLFKWKIKLLNPETQAIN